MEQFGLSFSHITLVKNNKTERGELLKEIVNLINMERAGTKFKPTTIKLIGIKLAHIPTKDLYGTISMGKDYKNRHGSFSKFLFGSIKSK